MSVELGVSSHQSGGLLLSTNSWCQSILHSLGQNNVVDSIIVIGHNGSYMISIVVDQYSYNYRLNKYLNHVALAIDYSVT